MRKLFGILLLILVVLVIAASANAFQDKLSLVRIYVHSDSELVPLEHLGIDIIGGEIGQYFDALVFSDDLKKITGMNYQVEVLKEEVRGQKDRGYTGYHTYDEVYAELLSTQSDHPSIAKLYDLGVGWDGHHIYGMKVSDNVASEEDERELFCHGLTHAREPMTVEIVLREIKELTDGYGNDPDCTHIVDNLQIWFIPLLNPDGYVHDGFAEHGWENFWRKNMRDNDEDGVFEDGTDGVDLNRNYPFGWGYDDQGSSPNWGDDTYRGPYAGSEPENQIVTNLAAEHNFVVGFSYHVCWPAILHPFSYNQTDPPSEQMAIYNQIFDQINAGIYDVLGIEYPTGRAEQILWYHTNGDYADYGMGAHGTYSFVIEAMDYYDPDEYFYPDDSYIPQQTQAQWEGFKNTCIWLADDYHPVDILINDFSAKPYTNKVELSWRADATEGENILGFNLYRKELAPEITNNSSNKNNDGYYRVNGALITGQNPYSFTDYGLKAETGYAYQLEVVLNDSTSTGATTSTETLSATSFGISSVYPLPADDCATVEFTLDKPCKASLNLYDLSGRLTAVLLSDNLEAGEHRQTMDTAGLASGLYILELRNEQTSTTRAILVSH